jgi:tetratricopeptide (TPR) repeat protein
MPFALALLAPSALAANPQKPWTRQDLQAVVDLALDTAKAGGPSYNGDRLLALVDALATAGAAELAHQVIARSGEILAPPRKLRSFLPSVQPIEKLVRLGDVADAELLANVEPDPRNGADLLGQLGAAKAAIGDLSGAKAMVDRLVAIPETPGDGQNDTLKAQITARIKGAGLAHIAQALVEQEAADAALQVADQITDPPLEVRSLSGIAKQLCSDQPRRNGRAGKGRTIADQAASLALEEDGRNSQAQPYARLQMLVPSAQAIAACRNDDAAVAYVQKWHPELKPRPFSLPVIAEAFAEAGDAKLARAVQPLLAPTDYKALLERGQFLRRAGDTASAIDATERAITALTEHPVAAEPPYGPAFGEERVKATRLLIQLGAHARVLPLIATFDSPRVRQQLAFELFEHEIQSKDAASLGKSLPAAIALWQASPAGGPPYAVTYLAEATIDLAEGGYRTEAAQAYRALQQELADPAKVPAAGPVLAMVARAQADMGAFDLALATAQASGPLAIKEAERTEPPVLGFPIGFSKSDVKTSPDAIVPGPQAIALLAIVRRAADTGDFDRAFAVEAKLEDGSGNTWSANVALSAIADAQIRRGNLHAAFATAQRIPNAELRWSALLALAVIPPSAH